MVREVERQLLALGRAREGDHVVIVAGTPPGRRGTTNMLKIHRLGDPT
jgi:pyruvate kinase